MNLNDSTKPGNGSRVAAVVGMFDGVHLGHRFLLDRLKEEALRRGLEPRVFTFPSHPLGVVAPSRAPALLTEPAEKLSRLTEAGFAASQIGFMVFDDSLRTLTASQFLEMLHSRYRVDFILKGFNNRFGTERHLTPEEYRAIAASNGIILTEATHLRHGDGDGAPPVSSSRIRQALEDGDITEANLMLGYHYPLSGTVITGKRLGRTLGFPTANLRPAHSSKLIPADGVYFCMAKVNGDSPRRAMVNIGTRPTVDGINTRRSIEAHLLDFDGEIYGKEVTLEFIDRLRSEIRFPSTTQLTLQLEADRERVRNFRISEQTIP